MLSQTDITCVLLFLDKPEIKHAIQEGDLEEVYHSYDDKSKLTEYFMKQCKFNPITYFTHHIPSDTFRNSSEYYRFPEMFLSNLRHIGENAFGNCSFESLRLKDDYNLKILMADAFAGSTFGNLYLELGEGMILGLRAFADCQVTRKGDIVLSTEKIKDVFCNFNGPLTDLKLEDNFKHLMFSDFANSKFNYLIIMNPDIECYRDGEFNATKVFYNGTVAHFRNNPTAGNLFAVSNYIDCIDGIIRK